LGSIDYADIWSVVSACLFVVYNRLYRAKDGVWQAEGKPNHPLEVPADMLSRLVDSSIAAALRIL
jgi:hypothetical protein